MKYNYQYQLIISELIGILNQEAESYLPNSVKFIHEAFGEVVLDFKDECLYIESTKSFDEHTAYIRYRLEDLCSYYMYTLICIGKVKYRESVNEC